MYTELQKEISKLLLEKARSAEELRKLFPGLSEKKLLKETEMLVKMGVVRKEKGSYSLVRKVIEGVEEKIKGWENPIIIKVMLEGHGPTKKEVYEFVDKMLADLEKEINIRILDKNIEDVIEVEGRFSSLIELVIAGRTLEDVFEFIMRRGASSVEVIRPNKIELDIRELQQILLNLANVVVGYENLLRFTKSQPLQEEGKQPL